MEYTVRTGEQLEPILKAFRKSKEMTQMELSGKIGVTQQALSLLEGAPHRASFERVLSYLATLGVEVVLREKEEVATQGPSQW